MDEEGNSVAIVAHGGAGGPPENADGCQAAAKAAHDALLAGAAAIDAAAAAVVVLEDDGRFNAGSGSVLCLDGKTIEMDAAVMDSEGKLGAVACLQRVKNPVLVALAVTHTPHWLLAGEGAQRFARVMGFPDHYAVSERARQWHTDLLARLRRGEAMLPGVENERFENYWNYEIPLRDLSAKEGCDTVGAVVRAEHGRFAVACSTGGRAPSLLGRVGDTPIIGSGFFAGPFGAVAVTGPGEEIVRHVLAYAVYRWIADGASMSEALDRGIGLFPDEIGIGIIAVSRTEAGGVSNRSMPMHALNAYVQ